MCSLASDEGGGPCLLLRRKLGLLQRPARVYEAILFLEIYAFVDAMFLCESRRVLLSH
jgi:hypothetical protein